MCLLVWFFWSQNILELKVCDEDNTTEDDHLLTVFFDVSKIQLGENIQLSFQLNPQVWVKFKGKAKGMLSGENVAISAFLNIYFATWVCPYVSVVDVKCYFRNYSRFWVLLLQTGLASVIRLDCLLSLMSKYQEFTPIVLQVQLVFLSCVFYPAVLNPKPNVTFSLFGKWRWHSLHSWTIQKFELSAGLDFIWLRQLYNEVLRTVFRPTNTRASVELIPLLERLFLHAVFS